MVVAILSRPRPSLLCISNDLVFRSDLYISEENVLSALLTNCFICVIKFLLLLVSGTEATAVHR